VIPVLLSAETALKPGSRKQAYKQIISKYKLWQSVEGMVGQAITGRGQLM